MPECTICGGKIPDGSRTCSVCGSSGEEFFPSGTMLDMDQPPKKVTEMPATLPAGGGYCPICARIYGPEHTDNYCTCGNELQRQDTAPPPMAAILDDVPLMDVPLAPILEEEEEIIDVPIVLDAPATAASVHKPSPGTPCIVLYGADKQPLKYFSLEKDAITIGRLDAVAGNFPDIDLDEWFDRAVIRKISRQHAVILRSRATGTFALRPLVGNTGTQLEMQMLQPMQDYPLRPGHRIILGGTIRLKFEIA